VLELEPENIDAVNNMGAVYYDTGDYDNAVKNFIFAVSKDPKSARGHFNLAEAYFKKEWWDEADIEYHKALELNTGLFEAYYKLGEVYRWKGWWDEAMKMWGVYIEKNPESELGRSAMENVRMVEIWKKEFVFSPSSSRKKLIK
jgi:tetratricopeptide (TPR) repeat protein